jgi:hypothetical protein
VKCPGTTQAQATPSNNQIANAFVILANIALL